MTSSITNMVMTVIGFIVSTMFIVFVCTRLICARIHLTASRSFARASGSNLSILERGLNGLEPLVVASFPTKKYRDLCLTSKENAQCTVCLSEYHEEDTLRILPVCGHSFHATCIDIWLQQHSTCPVCRVSLREAPERNWFMQPMFSSAVRSQHSMQYANPYYCHCMANGHRHFAGPLNSQTMEPIEEEALCRSEGDAGESFSVTTVNHNHVMTKDDPGNRKVESPSTL